MKRMKDFELDSFQFGLIEKSQNKFRFKLISEHDNLRTELNDHGDIIALIDKGVLLRNHIIKRTHCNYVYYVSDINIQSDDVLINILRKKFDPDNIHKSFALQKISLDSFKKKDIKLDKEKLAIPRIARRSEVQIEPPRAASPSYAITGMANILFQQEYRGTFDTPAEDESQRYPLQRELGRELAERIYFWRQDIESADSRLSVSQRIENSREFINYLRSLIVNYRSGSFMYQQLESFIIQVEAFIDHNSRDVPLASLREDANAYRVHAASLIDQALLSQEITNQARQIPANVFYTAVNAMNTVSSTF